MNDPDLASLGFSRTEPNARPFGDTWRAALQLRYFAPKEVANLLGFPASFNFPEGVAEERLGPRRGTCTSTRRLLLFGWRSTTLTRRRRRGDATVMFNVFRCRAYTGAGRRAYQGGPGACISRRLRGMVAYEALSAGVQNNFRPKTRQQRKKTQAQPAPLGPYTARCPRAARARRRSSAAPANRAARASRSSRRAFSASFFAVTSSFFRRFSSTCNRSFS